MARYFPIALSVEGRRCVVVGGGKVAARRVTALLEAGAEVVVIAPEADAVIRQAAAEGRVQLRPEAYQASHLEGMFLVLAATDRPEVNAGVVADARARGLLCNDAEEPERGDFLVPSTVRRGDLLLSVTTGGHSPSLAGRIAEQLAAVYGPEYAGYVALLGEVRRHVLATVADAGRRRAALNRVAADGAILALIREGRADEARARAFQCILSSSA